MIMKIIVHVRNAIRDGPDDMLLYNYRVMVFNATFNNVIGERNGVPGKNQ
jgi:hypothetical protein